ncbi:hypothetical protein Q9S_02858 [Enterococcus faecalis EnGen0080]|nr:hypothetical protein Q9S_02858 [Enterococcus faecalis EnGen0080]
MGGGIVNWIVIYKPTKTILLTIQRSFYATVKTVDSYSQVVN